MTTGAEIRAEDLVVEFATDSGPLRALDCPEIVVAAGSSLAVTGPSGCGKSTLLGVLAGLASPTAGSIVIGGTDLTALSESARTAFRQRTVGMVFQADNLLPFLTVAENVRLPLALSADRDEPQRRTDEVLDRLGLGSLAARLPDELSGGQRQRVAVARAVVHRPLVILADEPTGALDQENATVVVDLLLEVHLGLGATLVVVTHDPSVAGAMGRALPLRDGSIVTDREAGHVL